MSNRIHILPPELASRIAQLSGNISSVVAYDADQPERINITLRVEGGDRETILKAVSDQPGLEVLHVWMVKDQEKPCSTPSSG